jgi:hypothetical protein
MYEEFREQAEVSFLDEPDELEEGGKGIKASANRLRASISGMTPAQRVIVLALLLVVICLISALCLLVTGSVVLPIP